MDTLTAARAQMEVSLGFHMIFAALGIGLPLMMVIAEGQALRTGSEHYRRLARKWGRAAALTFAIGAISGTALAFELGLLWPRFMAEAGGIIGPAFTLEGFAFFIEAIFLALYLYGWERLSPRIHWLTGIPVAVSGMLSGVLVVAANAWMQTPAGIEIVNGTITMVDPLATFMAPAWLDMAIHSTLSCYIATGFAVAGVYATGMLRGSHDAYHRSAITIAMTIATIAALLQPISGHFTSRRVAQTQPAKLAAMAALFETTTRAPLLIGGIPRPEQGDVVGALEIPGALSLLLTDSFDATITGLNDFPPDERPNVVLTHIAFEVMVGCGFLLLGLGIWYWLKRALRGVIYSRLLQWAIVVGAPLGFIALEAGWIVTEVGRQPWVIHNYLRTRDAVTPVSGVAITFYAFSLLYVLLGWVLIVLLRRLATGAPALKNSKEESANGA